MSLEKYDQAIEEAQSEFQHTCAEMEGSVPKFKQAIAKFVSDWSKKLIEGSVTEDTERTKSLGKISLGELKKELERLIEEYPQIVDEKLEDVSIWFHRGDVSEEIDPNTINSYKLKESIKNALDDAIRDLIGHAGSALVMYGYANTRQYSHWEVRAGKSVRYTRGIIRNEEIDEHTKNFDDKIDKYVDAEKRLLKVKREKSEAEAKDLWDQA